MHGADEIVLGYNSSVLFSDDFIVDIRTDTGSQPDAVAIVPLLERVQQRLGAWPQLIYDQAAGTGKLMADVAAASDGQTQLVARLTDYPRLEHASAPPTLPC